MAAPPIVGKSKGPLLESALCRCCRSMKKCRILTAEYEWMGRKEVYSDMFMDCFGLLLSHLEDDTKECCICATCVVRLRDACAFRTQVLHCEETFMKAAMQTRDDMDKKWSVDVKTEPQCESDNDGDVSHSPEPIDVPTQEILPKTKTKPARKPKRKTKSKMTAKKQLVSDMKAIRAKLDAMMDKSAINQEIFESPDNDKAASKKNKIDLDRDDMVYKNTVTIVHYSYICPFVNRVSMYYCYYCKDQFTNPSELREHTLTHDPLTFEDMIEYNKLPKMDITKIDCRLCSEKIDDIEKFKQHITSAHNKKIFPITNEFLKFRLTMNNLKCTECSDTFPYIDLLVKHMIDHFGTFVCDMCGACFIELASLRSHIKNHNKIDTNFPCEICGKNLKSKYSRFLHVATVHEKKATINCYKCEATFMSYALRTKHLIEVHGDKRTFPCKFCDKVYNRRKTLGEHHRRNHLKVFRHKCDLCDQKFYLPSRLKEHMATHTGERNYRCEICDKSYPRLQSLQEHIRSHSNERRYKCNLCGTTFTQNGSLKNHMKSHHQYDLDASFS